MAKQQELQEQIQWFRKNYAVAEPELPLALDAQLLKQRAMIEVKPKITSPWKKLAPMACTLVLVAAVGFYSGLSADMSMEAESAVPQMAAYGLSEASLTQTTSCDEQASSMLRAVEYSTEIKTHINDSDSKKVLKELYPGVKFYSLVFTGDFWTVIHVSGIEGDVSVAVRADEAEVLEEENCYVVRDIESGKELRFDLITLKKMK